MRIPLLRADRPVRKVLVGTVVALGALTMSVSPAVAAPAQSSTAAARPATVTPDAETSIFIAYPDANYGGTPSNISGCGTHNMPFAVGSYEWLARGQTGYMYNAKNASGVVAATLASDTDASSTKGVGWKSIFILC